MPRDPCQKEGCSASLFCGEDVSSFARGGVASGVGCGHSAPLYIMFGMCSVFVFSVSSPLLAPKGGEACFAALYALAFRNVYLSGSDRWRDENAVQTVGLATLVPPRSLAAILLRGLGVQGFEEFSRWVGAALEWFSARVRCPGELSSSRPQGGRGMFRGLVCLGLLQCVFVGERSLDG